MDWFSIIIAIALSFVIAKPALAQSLPEDATYCVIPVVQRLQIRDSHERTYKFGGPTGYMFFDNSVGKKAGTIPERVGNVDFGITDAWASNVRGPWMIGGHSARIQWEFATVEGSGDASWTSHEVYPVVFDALGGNRCTSHMSNLVEVWLGVIEDDEWLTLSDDYVGFMRIQTNYCASEVFGEGRREGWTAVHTSDGPNWNDIAETEYRMWCYAPDAGGHEAVYTSTAAGEWWHDGSCAVEIDEIGLVVAVVNEFNERQDAIQDDYTISVPAWGITGELTYLFGGQTIRWSNTTVWTRGLYINGGATAGGRMAGAASTWMNMAT